MQIMDKMQVKLIRTLTTWLSNYYANYYLWTSFHVQVPSFEINKELLRGFDDGLFRKTFAKFTFQLHFYFWTHV